MKDDPSMAAAYIGVFGTLAGALLGWVLSTVSAWWTQKHNDEQARTEARFKYIEQQITFFYGPIVGLYREIEGQRKLGKKIFEVATAKADSTSQTQQRKQNIEADTRDKYRRQKELSAYKEIVRIFREHRGFADLDDCNGYQALLELAEYYDCGLNDLKEVAILVKPDLDNIDRIFNELEKTLEMKEQILATRRLPPELKKLAQQPPNT